MKRLILLLLWMIPWVMYAQHTDELKKEINKIKKSTQYLYAETTMNDSEEALSIALDILMRDAQKWVVEKKKLNDQDVDLVLTNISQNYEKMELPRGNMYRAFVYVKKSDIILAHNAIVTDGPQIAMGDSEVKISSEEAGEQSSMNLPQVIQQLLSLHKYDEVPPCLESLQKTGQIADYKRYASLQNPDAYVLIIYNRQAEVEAILSEGPDRINYKTGKPDGVLNYKGRGAIGVQLNK
ncbi:MAG: hypothetical protein SPE11_05980 [Parabacteroides sp.]|nr:hypothetical protein [Parabacteroides sp.]